MQDIIDRIYTQVRSEPITGKVASYIPELAEVDPSRFGISLITMDGRRYEAGDSGDVFSIQSISKVFTLVLAFSQLGDKIWSRVGKEPSGTAFNSLIQLEYEKGIPRNPFLNSGAIVICDVLLELYDDPMKDVLTFITSLIGGEKITINQKVKESELNTGYRNMALANFIKSYGNIKNDVNEVLDLYFSICSISMSCRQLAKSFLLFANHGKIVHSNENILTISQTKRMNALMQTCGFYDQAGDFTYKVGLPGKSGVGGGIVALLPGQYAVAVWSPPLNEKGNSTAGLSALEYLTTLTGYSIF